MKGLAAMELAIEQWRPLQTKGSNTEQFKLEADVHIAETIERHTLILEKPR